MSRLAMLALAIIALSFTWMVAPIWLGVVGDLEFHATILFTVCPWLIIATFVGCMAEEFTL